MMRKKKIEGKEVNLDRFTMADGSSIALAPDLGANIMNLQLAGKEIIQSPLMKNKASENYVPKIQKVLLNLPTEPYEKILKFIYLMVKRLNSSMASKDLTEITFTKKAYNYDHSNMIHGADFIRISGH